MRNFKQPRDIRGEINETPDTIRRLKGLPKDYDISWSDMPVGFQNPHCDFAMVHAPGECGICDEIAFGLQWLRLINRTNYTGHHDPELAPCPSEIFRSFDVANVWQGNHADVIDNAGAQELTKMAGWCRALLGFQEFYKDERELRRLRTEKEAYDRKIQEIERKRKTDA